MGIPYSKEINIAFAQVTPLVAAGFEVLQTTKNISILLAAVQILTAVLLALILLALVALICAVDPGLARERDALVTPVVRWLAGWVLAYGGAVAWALRVGVVATVSAFSLVSSSGGVADAAAAAAAGGSAVCFRACLLLRPLPLRGRYVSLLFPFMLVARTCGCLCVCVSWLRDIQLTLILVARPRRQGWACSSGRAAAWARACRVRRRGRPRRRTGPRRRRPDEGEAESEGRGAASACGLEGVVLRVTGPIWTGRSCLAWPGPALHVVRTCTR